MAQDPSYSIFTEGLPAVAAPVPPQGSNPALPPTSGTAPTGYDIFTKGLSDVVPEAAVSDQPSAADIAASEKSNQLRARSVEDLTADPSFDPIQEYQKTADPETQDKILQVFKARQTAPVDFGKVAEGILPGVVNAGKSIGTAVGTVAGEAGNVLSGNKTRVAMAAGELASGVETNITSLIYTIGKAGTFLKIRDGNGPKNDAEWRTLLMEHADFQDAIKEAASGTGTLSKALLNDDKYWGTIKEIVKDHGGSVDAQTVQDAAPILDPTLLIPLIAGAKSVGLAAKATEAGLAFKATDTGVALVNSAGKTILTADAGSTLFNNLAKVAKAGDVAFDAGDKASAFAKAAGTSALDTTGAVLEKVGGVAKGTGETIASAKNTAVGAIIGGAMEHGMGVTGLPLAGAAIGAAIPKVLKTAGETFIETAGKLRGEVPPGPVYQAMMDTARGPLVKGAAAGVGLTGDPLAAGFSALNFAGADSDQARGEALGGQAALGAAGHVITGGLSAAAPYFDIAGQVLKPGEASKPINSPGYGTVPELDNLNAETIAKLDPGAQNSINQFREAVRGRNTQIYVVPPEDFGRAYASFKAQEAAMKGERLTNEQLASYRDLSSQAAAAKGVVYDNFDLGDGVKRKVVFLNSDGGALQHEGGHVLTSLLDPPAYKAIADQISKRYTPDELAQFKAQYEDRLGQKISHADLIDEIMAENVAAVLNSQPIERLGAPKPVARSIYQHIGSLLETLGASPTEGHETALGARPDIGVGRLAENLLRAQETDARPVIEKAAKVDLGKVELNPVKPVAEGNPNIRATRADQNRFQRAAVDEGNAKAAKAVDANPNYGPEHKAAFVKIAAVLHQGGNNPHPIEVNYSAAKSDEFNAGRATRRAEQEKASTAENLGALPEHVRQMTQKVLLPERFEARGNGEVQLVAKSLDKIIGNAYRLVQDAHTNGVEHLVPYEHTVTGSLTDRGWTDLVSDVQTYTANHANGFAGTGKTVVVPKGYLGEIPAENKAFKPKALPQDKADFINTIMALPPPKTTARKGVTKSGVPANVIARTLAEANAKESLPSVTSNPKKNLFPEPHNVEIAEFNPLRDQLARAGVKVRDLNEVTERINLSRMSGDVKVRNDLDFSRPSTDLIRAGFMPDPAKPVRRTDPEINKAAEEYTKAAGIDYKPYTGYAKLQPELGKQIADWYDKAKSSPDDPAVKAAYDALATQTKAQFEAMTKAGYTAEPWTGKGEPYNSSADMVNDVLKNKHLWFFKTENGFGSGPEANNTGNPLLADAGNGLVVNDLFRAVHDFFGHAKGGYEFGPRGEYNAFLAHSAMFDDAALPALGAETLAQNAWVNFGPHLRDEAGNIPAKGDEGYVPLQNRPFADQKVVVVPPDLLARALEPNEKSRPIVYDEVPTKNGLGHDLEGTAARLVWKEPNGKYRVSYTTKAAIDTNEVPKGHDDFDTLEEAKAHARGDGEFVARALEPEQDTNTPNTPNKTKADMIKEAVGTPDVTYQYSVFRPGDGIKGIEQVDVLGKGSRPIVSSNPKDLIAAGAKIPEVPDWVPQGKYTAPELEALIAKGPPDAPNASFLPGAPVQHIAKKALPDSLGNETLNLIHFDSSGMKEVDPRFFGRSGITPSSELAGQNRSYFYEQGAHNGKDLVNNRPQVYGAKISGALIYDGDADKLGYGDMVNREKADQMLKDAGYVGIARTGGSGKNEYRQLEIFNKTNVFPIKNPDAKFMPENPADKNPAPKLAVPSKFRTGRTLGPDDNTSFAVKPAMTIQPAKKERPSPTLAELRAAHR